VIDLQEIEAIKQLKYRYFRHLDLKQWDQLRECFAEDATSSYSGGRYAFEGRDAIMKFLVESLGRSSMLTAHHGHHPEIELTSDTTARGVWALEDVVIDTQNDITITGAAFYTDEYEKVRGEWKLKSTGYVRTFEELEKRSDRPGLTLTANRFASE
jgi:hypothetical protein